MAKDKKAVVLYCDLIHTIEKMDNETAGQFFKHYLQYINDLNPKTDNLLVELTFESVKQNLKRDLKKWEVRAEKSRENGKLGGRPPKNQVGFKETKKTKQVISEPKKPDTVNVKDNVKDKDINTNIVKAFPNEKTFIDWFNYGRLKLLGKEGKTKILGSTDKNNFKLLNSTYTRDEFKHAVTMMAEDEWVKTASKFTVSHLLVPANFDKYLNKEKFIPRIVNNQPLN